ncbi:hypothetical protein [Lysobacter arvi]|uniref:Uncharacterized protein n=1 Tax=Lysobacter arvi TaxID=3038776 RepID=A0ABU1CB54_9GAMM|nr:hypothetical protein [Lysobacter arvi]MDR0182431.1 hypothetical protein [Lysobacter arvi]
MCELQMTGHFQPSHAGPRRLSAAHLRLIDALAKKAAEDYLREQALRDAASSPQRTNPVPLPRSKDRT